MSYVTGSRTVGMEQIQRAAILHLHKHLNLVLGQLEAEWNVADQDYSSIMGRPYTPIVMEPLLPENFYVGHRPSLINAPIDRYPNCSVWTARAAPSPDSAYNDHVAIFNNIVYVELMAKATPEEGEDFVNSRIQRMTEAAVIAMERDPSLGGIVTGFDGDPTIEISNVFTRKDRGGDASGGTRTAYGQEWFWQGSRLEYAVRKEASIGMSSETGYFRDAGFGIDQE